MTMGLPFLVQTNFWDCGWQTHPLQKSGRRGQSVISLAYMDKWHSNNKLTASIFTARATILRLGAIKESTNSLRNMLLLVAISPNEFSSHVHRTVHKKNTTSLCEQNVCSERNLQSHAALYLFGFCVVVVLLVFFVCGEGQLIAVVPA